MKANKLKIVLIIIMAMLTVIFFTKTASAENMFTPPNGSAKVLTRYFNNGQSFEFCWNKYDVIKERFDKEKMCVMNDRGRQVVSFVFGMSMAKVDAPEIVVRYNTLDRGLVDKTYPVAVDSRTGGALILTPEDKSDVVNMLINSKDVIVFYHIEGVSDYQMAYYPLPLRDASGNVKTQEVR